MQKEQYITSSLYTFADMREYNHNLKISQEQRAKSEERRAMSHEP